MRVIIMCLFLQIYALEEKFYTPNWNDLDKRPLPQWYDVAKIGIFVHWGVYSVPGFRSEWFWYYWNEGDKEILDFIKNISYTGTYQDFAKMFTGESFDPEKWAELFAKAGAQYVVFTAKHHDGFALFPSSTAQNWNSLEIGPQKDIVGLLGKAVRKQDMKYGIYYSFMEWENKYYKNDKSNNYGSTYFVDNVVWPDLKQLVKTYKPSVWWSDGDWEAEPSYWKATDFLAWLYNESPVRDYVVVNDRWGSGSYCRHGDYYNCDDRFNPKKLQHHKWENAFTIDKKSWGYRRNLEPEDTIGISHLLEIVTTTVSCGGNALINVGPTKEGLIPPIFEERLLQLGEWLEVNGEAIYDTSPWYHQNDSLNPHVWYTCKKQTYDALRVSDVPRDNDVILAIYAIFLLWPVDDKLSMKDLAKYLKNKNYVINLLKAESTITLNYTITSNVVTVYLPDGANYTSKSAYVLKITEQNSY